MTQFSQKAAIPYAELTDAPNIQTYAQGLSTALDTMVMPNYATRTTRDATNPTPADGDCCYVVADKRQYLFYNGVWNNQTIVRGTELISFSSLDFTTVTVTFPIAFEFAPFVFANISTGAGSTARWMFRAYSPTTTNFVIYVAAGVAGLNQTWSSIPCTWMAI